MLGDNIRNIRKKQKKTLTDISEVTGLSVGYLSQLERNMIEPSLSALRKIAKSLDVPVYIFYAIGGTCLDIATVNSFMPNEPISIYGA